MASFLLHTYPPSLPLPSSKSTYPPTHLRWGRCRLQCFHCVATAGEATLQKELIIPPSPRTAPKPAVVNPPSLFDKMPERTDQSARFRSLLDDVPNRSGKSGSARDLSDEMPKSSGKDGSAVIVALAHAGKHAEVVKLFGRIQREEFPVSKFVVPSMLGACVGLRDGRAFRGMHGLVVKCGLRQHVVVGTALVDGYVGFGLMDDARKAFDEISNSNLVSWNVVIGGYVRSSWWDEAWDAFAAMQRAGVHPNQSILVLALQTCGPLGCLACGKQLHAKAVVCGFMGNTTLWNCLIDMYAKCGNVDSSTLVFETMIGRDQVSWNTIIASYVRVGLCEEALSMIGEMQEAGCTVDRFTLGSGVAACAHLADIDRGRAFHGYLIRRALDTDVVQGSALVDMYGKCGYMELAQLMFHKMDERNFVSWDALLAGYVRNGQVDSAIRVFRQMKSANLRPTQHTFVGLLKLCGDWRYKEYGRQIHAHAIKFIHQMNVVLETELVDMYAKCGCMEVARLLFLRMNERNLISWNALISGYAEDGQPAATINIYHGMELACIRPDQYTFAALLSLCRYQGFVRQGRQIHAHLIKAGFETNVVLQTLLVHMYVKCRQWQDAENVCTMIKERNLYVQDAFSKVYKDDCSM